MKKFILTLLLPLLLLSSCGIQSARKSYSVDPMAQYRQQQIEWRRVYRGSLEMATASMLKHLMKEISPMSGRDPRYAVHLDNIHYDEQENVVQAEVELNWQARDLLSGVRYGTCVINGVLSLYLPTRAIDQTKAHLSNVQYNKQLKDVSKRKHLEMLQRGVTINL